MGDILKSAHHCLLERQKSEEGNADAHIILHDTKTKGLWDLLQNATEGAGAFNIVANISGAALHIGLLSSNVSSQTNLPYNVTG